MYFLRHMHLLLFANFGRLVLPYICTSAPHCHKLLLYFTSVWMMPCFFIIFILYLYFVVVGTVVSFFVHFLICPLCCLVCYAKYFPLFNSNKSPTRCNSFSVYYPDVYLQLNMFWAFSRPLSGVRWLQWQPLVLPSYRGDTRAVFVVNIPQERNWYWLTIPEAVCTVVLLMMGGGTAWNM